MKYSKDKWQVISCSVYVDIVKSKAASQLLSDALKYLSKPVRYFKTGRNFQISTSANTFSQKEQISIWPEIQELNKGGKLDLPSCHRPSQDITLFGILVHLPPFPQPSEAFQRGLWCQPWGGYWWWPWAFLLWARDYLKNNKRNGRENLWKQIPREREVKGNWEVIIKAQTK